MRNLLLASALLGGLFMLSGQPASAAPAAGLRQLHTPSAVTQADYYWNHRRWHHRRWRHHRWQYWD